MKTSFLGLKQSITLQKHETGLLFRDGQFVRVLTPGEHEFAKPWRSQLTAKVFDLRERQMLVQGQELLSADQVALKVSAWVVFRIADALTLHRTMEHPEAMLHGDVQLALRQVLGTLTAEDFLNRKVGFAVELKALLEERFTSVGLTLERADIRDVMLPADLKRAFTEALKSKQEAGASLEKARSETATLRTLANAAKLLRDNPELLSLRYLQTITEVGTDTGNTLVLGLADAAKLVGPASK
jgi:regulator of protease activity HflC (stomatin/prohibitin superfamily)